MYACEIYTYRVKYIRVPCEMYMYGFTAVLCISYFTHSSYGVYAISYKYNGRITTVIRSNPNQYTFHICFS